MYWLFWIFISSSIQYLFISFSIELSYYLLEFIIYYTLDKQIRQIRALYISEYESFVRKEYIYYKYILPHCILSLHSLNGVFDEQFLNSIQHFLCLQLSLLVFHLRNFCLFQGHLYDVRSKSRCFSFPYGYQINPKAFTENASFPHQSTMLSLS